MAEIVLEDLLFIVLVILAATVVAFLIVRFTPIGLRLQQSRNRRAIEQAAEQTCPIHGPHAPTDLVRLPNGDRICPECFKEAVNG
jgi:hypothetical protein